MNYEEIIEVLRQHLMEDIPDDNTYKNFRLREALYKSIQTLELVDGILDAWNTHKEAK